MDCEVKVLTRKKNNPNEAVYEELNTSIRASFSGVLVLLLSNLQKQLGLFLKEKEGLVGKFVTEFFNGIKPFALEEVDIAPAVGSVFAVKNEEEKERVRRAGNT